jgi:hypothetical protein
LKVQGVKLRESEVQGGYFKTAGSSGGSCEVSPKNNNEKIIEKNKREVFFFFFFFDMSTQGGEGGEI